MLISWTWGTENNLGLYDFGICTSCGKPKLHYNMRIHKHLIISFIPVYISNKYYKKCETCDKETLIDKKDAKQRLKELNLAFPSKDPTSQEKAEAFFNSIIQKINENDVITTDADSLQFVINTSNKEKVKKLVWNEYRLTFPFPKAFYDNCVEYYTEITYDNLYSANVLIKELNQADTIENRLKQLNELYEKKLISEQEYLSKRQKILNDV